MTETENSNEQETPRAQPATGFSALTAHIARNRIDFALWCTRFATILFTFNYLIPIFGSGYNMYYKALLANSATSALRLHQRLPQVQLSREFLGKVFLEDSAHYLLYSMIFFYSPPVTWVLLPVFLFALLHIASYSLGLIELLGPNALGFVRMGIGLVEVQSVNLLRTIAFSEIFLFPLLILSLFGGRATLMTLFVYYRFLTLRYSSRRNPYTRNTFGELRMLVEGYAQNPSCPAAIRNMVHKLVGFISRLAPPVITTEQQ
uniref:EOG090X0CJA n=1 Tax=Simocephalus serrulatus TaxID=117539 RepID=A0A4Y7NNW9_9CRUS|nr:EOG090X0CJA [Simocephalus serrulatus]SVE94473.1 EOG090X0CJA [Simocephalus serrulatus]